MINQSIEYLIIKLVAWKVIRDMRKIERDYASGRISTLEYEVLTIRYYPIIQMLYKKHK